VKIISVNFHDVRHTFAVSFDDGITIILNMKLELENMLSTGLDSIFLQTYTWPTEKDLQNRVEMGIAWVSKNKNRYKHYKKLVAVK